MTTALLEIFEKVAGRKRKPRSLRLLEGNRGKRKVPAEPSYAAELPATPSYLAGIGLEEWARLAPIMIAQGVSHGGRLGGVLQLLSRGKE